MLNRFIKLAIFFLLLALCLYVVFLNRAPASLYLSPTSVINANSGLIFIGIFSTGIIISALVGFYFGLKAYFRERHLLYRERISKLFYQGMLRARSLATTGQVKRAVEAWGQLLRKDPGSLIGQLELAVCHETSGELQEALRLLEELRTKEPKNHEVLFRTAQIYASLGNKTSALDCLNLIIAEEPSALTLIRARNIYEELERYDEALRCQADLDNIDHEDPMAQTRLEYKQLLANFNRGTQSRENFYRELKNFIKKHPDSPEALRQLSALELEKSNPEEATFALVRAAKASGSISGWFEAATIWVKQGYPEKALAAIRTAQREANGLEKLEAQLELACLELKLNMLDDAKLTLDRFLTSAQEAGSPSAKFKDRYLALRANCLGRLGDIEGCLAHCRSLAEKTDLPVLQDGSLAMWDQTGPSPYLSTP